MNKQFKYFESEPIKDKPVVKFTAIRAAVVCVVLVLFVLGVVGGLVWLKGRV